MPYQFKNRPPNPINLALLICINNYLPIRQEAPSWIKYVLNTVADNYNSKNSPHNPFKLDGLPFIFLKQLYKLSNHILVVDESNSIHYEH